jgi:3-oxoacyl-[acyl-carrier protein] reductase
VIVNISSVAGVTGVGSNVAYAASKAALDSMTRSLARALAPNIRVLSVSPGWVLGEYAARFDPAYIQAQIDATPLKRLATPDDVADAVLAATQLRSSTGNIIAVDGGRPLGV